MKGHVLERNAALRVPDRRGMDARPPSFQRLGKKWESPRAGDSGWPRAPRWETVVAKSPKLCGSIDQAQAGRMGALLGSVNHDGHGSFVANIRPAADGLPQCRKGEPVKPWSGWYERVPVRHGTDRATGRRPVVGCQNLLLAFAEHQKPRRRKDGTRLSWVGTRDEP